MPLLSRHIESLNCFVNNLAERIGFKGLRYDDSEVKKCEVPTRTILRAAFGMLECKPMKIFGEFSFTSRRASH